MDPDTNDDIIYPAVDWKDDFVGTLVLILIVVFVVGPIVQIILFAASLYSPLCRVSRRYLEGAEEEAHKAPESGDDHDDMWASPF